LRRCDNTEVDYPVINSTFDYNSINKELLGFRGFEFSSPCSLNFPIEPAFDQNGQAVVDMEYYNVSRIVGYRDGRCS